MTYEEWVEKGHLLIDQFEVLEREGVYLDSDDPRMVDLLALWREHRSHPSYSVRSAQESRKTLGEFTATIEGAELEDQLRARLSAAAEELISIFGETPGLLGIRALCTVWDEREIILELYERLYAPVSGSAADPISWFMSRDDFLARARRFFGVEIPYTTLRHYQRLGLIPKPLRLGRGGKAYYSVLSLVRLMMISSFGGRFSLSELAKVLPDLFPQYLEAMMPQFQERKDVWIGLAINQFVRLRHVKPLRRKGLRGEEIE